MNYEFARDKLVANIVAGTNRQNAISQADLVSNDRRQIELERNLRPLQYIYLRKKHTKTEARRIYGSFGNIYLTKDDLARASAASTMDQHTVRSGVSHLYGEAHYDKVFPTSEPLYYLPKYWLTKRVTRASKGKTEWGYPKWMVVGFLWGQLSGDLGNNKSKQAFITAMQRDDTKLGESLDKMINIAFRTASSYYNDKKGMGNSKIEISQFYRNRKGRNAEFSNWWTSSKNKYKSTFNSAHRHFKERLKDL